MSDDATIRDMHPGVDLDPSVDTISLISIERDRQVQDLGYDSGHDDVHTEHQLALAAACYAAPDHIFIGSASSAEIKLEDAWPWLTEEDKRDPGVRCWYPGPLATILTNTPAVRAKRIRELVKAGALIVAEIDRLRRLNSNG